MYAIAHVHAVAFQGYTFILTPINHIFSETVYKISYFAPAPPIKGEIDFQKPHLGLDHIEKLGTSILHTDSECEN